MILSIQPLSQANGDIIPPPSRLSPTFHNSPPPKNEIQREKALHRTAAFLIAAGTKPKDAAAELQVAEATIYNWLRQSWFQQNVTQIISDHFGGDVSAMLKSAATTAIIVEMDLMQNSTSDQVKLKAAQDILDRHRGKATNFITVSNSALSESPEKELKRLEDELGTPSLP